MPVLLSRSQAVHKVPNVYHKYPYPRDNVKPCVYPDVLNPMKCTRPAEGATFPERLIDPDDGAEKEHRDDILTMNDAFNQ